jgi:hypothetical protein
MKGRKTMADYYGVRPRTHQNFQSDASGRPIDQSGGFDINNPKSGNSVLDNLGQVGGALYSGLVHPNRGYPTQYAPPPSHMQSPAMMHPGMLQLLLHLLSGSQPTGQAQHPVQRYQPPDRND